MKYFKLGKHNVSKYCLGTWSLGSNKKNNVSYGKINNYEVNKILEYSYDNGINFFDTANVYGDSEQKLGKFFNKKREKVFFATKVGCVSFQKKLNFSKKIIQKQVFNSLKNLKSDYLDIVQLYNPPLKDQNLKYAIDVLDNFKNQKKIRFIGVSVQQPLDYLYLRKLYKFDTIQCNFNVLDQRIFNKNLKGILKIDKVKIFARTVLNFGIFSEEFLNNKKIKFNKNDHRYYWDINQINLWIEFINKIKLFSERPIENTCYRFCNSFQTDSIIFGAKKINHIKTAINQKNFLKLSTAELRYISEVYKTYSKIKLIKPKIAMKSN